MAELVGDPFHGLSVGGSSAAEATGVTRGAVVAWSGGAGDCVDDENGPFAKSTLTFEVCKVPVQHQQHFLLDDGGWTGCSAEWQSALWGNATPAAR